ncbi:hypothetical protein BJV82DRAFT_587256 [Fennellomyces sp. T-0311]|nr:hypothetical protein BJV82DRAFT_587256 [Fennellomyces sp. T-0311]
MLFFLLCTKSAFLHGQAWRLRVFPVSCQAHAVAASAALFWKLWLAGGKHPWGANGQQKVPCASWNRRESVKVKKNFALPDRVLLPPPSAFHCPPKGI